MGWIAFQVFPEMKTMQPGDECQVQVAMHEPSELLVKTNQNEKTIDEKFDMFVGIGENEKEAQEQDDALKLHCEITVNSRIQSYKHTVRIVPQTLLFDPLAST